MELLYTRSFEVENEVENSCQRVQKLAVYLGYFIMREKDSNPRSPVAGRGQAARNQIFRRTTRAEHTSSGIRLPIAW
jgi:hypothetical protein